MTDAIVQSARKQWGLGNAPITLIAARENHVYQVDFNDQRFALRLHRQGYRTQAEIHSELLWMDMLANNGMPVPKPVDALDGTCVRSIDGVTVDMLSWIDGEPLSELKPTLTLYRQLGQLLANMHLLADKWKAASGLSRPVWDLTGSNPAWGRYWENPQLTATQQSRFIAFRLSASLDIDALQTPDVGLIHADLVPDNVLVNKGQLHPIDFDDGGFGHRMFDIATVTLRSRRINNNTDFAGATLQGYGELRTIDHGTLPLFEALRACSYVGWNITRINEAGGEARNGRFIAEAIKAVDRYFDQ